MRGDYLKLPNCTNENKVHYPLIFHKYYRKISDNFLNVEEILMILLIINMNIVKIIESCEFSRKSTEKLKSEILHETQMLIALNKHYINERI